MTANKRNKLEVITGILRTRGSKTSIGYGANLSYDETQEYLALLREAGFLQQTPAKNNGRRDSALTEKGQKLLELIEVTEGLFDEGVRRSGDNLPTKVAKRNGRD